MTGKEFSKLSRGELLKLLLTQGQEQKRLEEQMSELTRQKQQLEENFERLKKRLDDKDEQIEHLKRRLDNKDIKIKELMSGSCSETTQAAEELQPETIDDHTDDPIPKMEASDFKKKI